MVVVEATVLVQVVLEVVHLPMAQVMVAVKVVTTVVMEKMLHQVGALLVLVKQELLLDLAQMQTIP
jgi:hypothetical protein